MSTLFGDRQVVWLSVLPLLRLMSLFICLLVVYSLIKLRFFCKKRKELMVMIWDMLVGGSRYATHIHALRLTAHDTWSKSRSWMSRSSNQSNDQAVNQSINQSIGVHTYMRIRVLFCSALHYTNYILLDCVDDQKSNNSHGRTEGYDVCFMHCM